MERTSIVVPNVRLKRQRELKGWTQEQLADFVETTTANISRWENGKMPGPHFRSQLCTLFNKTPQELGWFDEHTEMAASPVEHIEDEPMTRWPFPITSDNYYPLPGREKDIQQLLDVLHNPQGASMLVLDGLGGLGKTALAIELSRRALEQRWFTHLVGDSAKQEVFTGNEIVQVNEATLDFDALLDAIARQCRHWELLTLKTPEKCLLIGHILQQERYLVLVDNLETAENANALVSHLRNLLGNSRAILTSRKRIPHDFVFSHSLQQLSVEDTIFFLQQDIIRHPYAQLLHLPDEKLIEIHTLTGGAPLALKLVIAQARFLELDVVLQQLRQAGSKLYPFLFCQSWLQLSPIAQKVLIYIGRTATTAVSWDELSHIGIASNETLLADAIEQLAAYSLLDVTSIDNQLHYNIHQLTRHFVNSDLPVLWREQGLL